MHCELVTLLKPRGIDQLHQIRIFGDGQHVKTKIISSLFKIDLLGYCYNPNAKING
jgi:hypothetical protein